MELPIDRWNPETGTAELTKYPRCWRQELESAFGTEPAICAHMEQVVVDSDDALLGRKPLPEVRRTLSAVISDPDVQAYMALHIALLKKWWLEDEAARATTNTETPTL